MKALLVIDMQNDFVSHSQGRLHVEGAEFLGPYIDHAAEGSPLVVATQDWHPVNDPSFQQFPPHCIRGSWGAELSDAIPNVRIKADMILRKPGNSAFFTPDGSHTGLHGFLREAWVDQVLLCGVALDVCVRETAIDAAKLGYGVMVALDLTRAVDPSKVDEIVAEFRQNGVGVM